MNGCFKIFVLGLLTFSMLAFSSAQEAPKDPAPKQSPLTKVDETPPTDKTPVDDDKNQSKPKPADNTSVEQLPAPDAIDVDELLRQLESIIRDPFAPDAAIIREQKKANNEFVEIQQNVNIPEITLVGYIEQTIDEKTTHLAGIKLDNRVYFVRESDRLTITRNSGNIVIEITSINDGFVEVKLGTLAESLIIR